MEAEPNPAEDEEEASDQSTEKPNSVDILIINHEETEFVEEEQEVSVSYEKIQDVIGGPQRDLIPLREQKPPRKSLTELYLKELKEKSIFDQVLGECCCSPGRPAPSMLVSGFGMRNWESLQNALLADELARRAREAGDEEEEHEEGSHSIPMPSYSTSSKSGEMSETTQTESLSGSTIQTERKRLEYLMGLDTAGEEVPKVVVELPEESEQDLITGRTEMMRKAQRYLRTHRIFEFFQFMITLMLSERPDDPIHFLLQLLDKLLLFRSGIGPVVVLYEKKHLEQLFHLMDRMRTGFIERSQYEIGMKTLGICIYDKNPPLSSECMVSKDFFVDEAYECQIDILNDLIYTNKIKTPPQLKTPPPSKVGLAASLQSMSSFGSPYVVSPSFYQFLTKKKKRIDDDAVSIPYTIGPEDQYYGQ
ncbi:unnamed protein product [Brassicogethes aeneus]|uniref:EF-hand domain-containing protein n=1 Tax=Brassicogethes aeneus TaxID=1431903 RepID=A0A9P0AT16_BRAAE|nr:unnamed protein product [Brassicogethes aeneus]